MKSHESIYQRNQISSRQLHRNTYRVVLILWEIIVLPCLPPVLCLPPLCSVRRRPQRVPHTTESPPNPSAAPQCTAHTLCLAMNTLWYSVKDGGCEVRIHRDPKLPTSRTMSCSLCEAHSAPRAPAELGAADLAHWQALTGLQ